MCFCSDEHVSSSSPHRRLTVVCHVQLRTTQLDNRCSEWRPSVWRARRQRCRGQYWVLNTTVRFLSRIFWRFFALIYNCNSRYCYWSSVCLSVRHTWLLCDNVKEIVLSSKPNHVTLKPSLAFDVKMVNGFRYYRALESVSIASALSIPLLPFTHARSQSINAYSLNSNFLQLGRKSGGRPQRAVHPHTVTCQHGDTHYFSRPRTL